MSDVEAPRIGDNNTLQARSRVEGMSLTDDCTLCKQPSRWEKCSPLNKQLQVQRSMQTRPPQIKSSLHSPSSLVRIRTGAHGTAGLWKRIGKRERRRPSF